MAEQGKPPSLEEIEARLRAARGAGGDDKGKGSGPPASGKGMGLGFRIAIEFVAGVAVGVAIGYGLDRWLGTAPLMMVLFLLLGGAAGVLNAYRAAKGMDETVGLGSARKRGAGQGKD